MFISTVEVLRPNVSTMIAKMMFKRITAITIKKKTLNIIKGINELATNASNGDINSNIPPPDAILQKDSL